MGCKDAEVTGNTVVMQWTILPSGSVSNVTATGELKGTSAASCLTNVVKKLKFPSYSGPQMEPIKFPFKF